MPNPKNQLPKPSKSVLEATKSALRESIDSKLAQAVLTRSTNGEFHIDANMKGLAKDTMQQVIINDASRRLCEKGLVTTLTCESRAPGKATYFFDFSTERGRERIEVGFSMDNDRAAYLGKKVLSFIQGK